MDVQARKKALFRAKVKEQEEKRVDSPLVSYNEFDQPVCHVCEIVLKSDSLWHAHQVSRKHHQAVIRLKGNAFPDQKHMVDASALNEKPAVPRPPPDHPLDEATSHPPSNRPLPDLRSESSPSSELPPNFFDEKETKRPEPGGGGVGRVKAKGSLPEGFFDNRDADLRARGIDPVRPDTVDEYKEFERSIEDDLRGVDDRMEEEEFDAAEAIQGVEAIEQIAYRDRVDALKRKIVEVGSSRSLRLRGAPRDPDGTDNDDNDDDDDDDGDDDDFVLDWRAKHL